MKAIITGATGFIGRNLAEDFQANGIQVIATGRSMRTGKELGARGIEFRAADICDISQFSSACRPVDCLIHCAARAGDWGRYQDFYEANVMGTRNVIRMCRECGIPRLIFISSPSVYFDGSNRFGISEEAPLPVTQRTHYAKTKVINEGELMALTETGLDVIILRPRAVHGPHDATITPRILRMAGKGRIPLINGGQALVDVTYIGNLRDAIRLCMAAPYSSWNEVYNVTNGHPITVHDWFDGMLKAFHLPFAAKNIPMGVARVIASLSEVVSRLPFGPKKPLMTRFSVDYMGTSMTLSIEKARQNLGYSPTVSNAEGFKRTADWFRANRDTTGQGIG